MSVLFVLIELKECGVDLVFIPKMNSLFTKIILAIGILTIVTQNICHGNVFTSVMKMTKVPEIEKRLIGFLEVYLQSEEESDSSQQFKE